MGSSGSESGHFRVLAGRSELPPMPEALRPISGIYVHVPFCRSKCDYCAFESVTQWDATIEAAFVARVTRHLELYAGLLGDVKTAYIGGGTPSVLRHKSLAQLLAAMQRLAPNVTEITLEANPESLTPGAVSVAASGGVTRLSLGVQSFRPSVLSALGRRPSRLSRLTEIRDSWLGALSADLIIDTPGAAEGDASASVAHCLDLSVDHISLYSLSVEPGTPLSNRIGYADVLEISEEEDEAIHRMLSDGGFDRYEISNFARQGFECAHNRGYWSQHGYLGVGPSAVSTFYGTDGALRVSQPDSVEEYTGGDLSASACERLDRGDLIVEHVMLALRTRQGVGYERMDQLFGQHLAALAPQSLELQIGQGMLAARPFGVVATRIGWRYLDSVLRALIAEIRSNLDTLQV